MLLRKYKHIHGENGTATENSLKRRGLVEGVGTNDADYNVQVKKYIGKEDGRDKYKKVWVCPFYRSWASMLRRCYNKKYHASKPTYKDCYVCNEWLIFSNFKAWMENQDWEGRHLDKDLIKAGNREYAPEYCAFVDNQTNSFIRMTKINKNQGLEGVTKVKDKYRATVKNGQRNIVLGTFRSAAEAHEAWNKAKRSLASELANRQSDERVKKALLDFSHPDSDYIKLYP